MSRVPHLVERERQVIRAPALAILFLPIFTIESKIYLGMKNFYIHIFDYWSCTNVQNLPSLISWWHAIPVFQKVAWVRTKMFRLFVDKQNFLSVGLVTQNLTPFCILFFKYKILILFLEAYTNYILNTFLIKPIPKTY